MVRDLGSKLKLSRKRTGLKQKEVADRLGVTTPTVSSYEAKGANPNAETLMKLASIYGESSDYLLGLDRKKALFIDELTDEEIDTLHHLADLFRKNRQSD